jgi:uncharacterized metal-binding protein YceD (DUF177 family)
MLITIIMTFSSAVNVVRITEKNSRIVLDSFVMKNSILIYDSIKNGNDYTVELDETVREEFVLSFPTKHLCSEECLGLCPVCGKDLNTEKCSCNDKTVDPKWGDILKMFEE